MATAAFTTTDGANVAAAKRRLRRESFIFAAIFSLMLFGLSLVLIAWRTEQLLTQLSQDRVTRLMQQVTHEAERGLRFGVAVADQVVLRDRLQRLLREDDSLRAVFLDTEQGTPIFQGGEVSLRNGIQRRWLPPLETGSSERSTEAHNNGALIYIGMGMLDATGAPAATLWAAVDPVAARHGAHEAAGRMFVRALPLMVCTLFLVWWALLRWSRIEMTSLLADGFSPGYGKIFWTIFLFTVLVAPTTMVWITHETARPFVTQQVQENAEAAGRTVASQINRAFALGVPWSGLRGVDALFSRELSETPELSYLALQRNGTSPAKITWSESTPAIEHSQTDSTPHREVVISGGRVLIGYPADYVNRQLGDMLIDLVLALVIAAVLVRELTCRLWRRSLLAALWSQALKQVWQSVWNHARARRATLPGNTPLPNPPTSLVSLLAENEWRGKTARTTQLAWLRLTVFLVALSEELLRPFFTVFASELQPVGSVLSPTMIAGLPVAAFMTTLALVQPAGPALARRFDLRLGLVFSALVGTVALAATAWTKDIWTLVTLRAAGGAAYGLALILVQTAIVRITPPGQRAQGLAEVAAAIVAAGIVGPPFGGMIAARGGDVTGFLACALCMAAALVAVLQLRLDAVTTGQAMTARTGGLATTGGWRGYWAVLHEPRAVCVILGAALPARLVAVTILSVVVPLYMRELQQPAAVSGRIILLYFLCFASSASLVAYWSDLLERRKPFVVAGGILSAIACLMLPVLGQVWGLAICCALLGFGQALQSSPQIALATEAFERHAPDAPQVATPEQALAAFRLIERIGSIVAPFVTAVAVTAFGYAGAVVAVGVLLAIATLGLIVGLRSTPPHQTALAA